ncbi:MAG TPA: patatin-like phospholipase RssA [Gammaproteobacteria bacterium]|jgi:NTE family protein|nr:patatin-like phospholipase RssA [Gammaproteobacteria bacterium]
MMTTAVNKRRRIGIALGGGAARGWAHIGILRWLREHELEPDIICGTSIGALVGAAAAAGNLDDFEGWVRELTWQDVVSYLDVSFGGGLISGKRLFQHFESQLSDRNIEDLQRPFGAVATELTSGQEVWFREGSMYRAVRASVALPGLMTPVKVGEQWLVDGGLVNPVPVSLCRALGAERIIAIDINADLLNRRATEMQEADSSHRLDKALSRMQEINWLDLLGEGFKTKTQQWVNDFKRDSNALPSLVDVLTQSVYIMQMRITRARMAGDPPDILLSPKLGHIRLVEFHRAAEAIEIGYRCADEMGAAITERLR